LGVLLKMNARGSRVSQVEWKRFPNQLLRQKRGF
jgi:hypothetical protein